MPIDFLPTWPEAASLAACCGLPVMVLGLSHGPWRIGAPGRRFVFAAAGCWTVWLAAMIALGPGAVDLLTGALLLATATIVYFTLWTLVAWGFTLSMLLVLHQSARPMSVDEWAQACTNGKPFEAFARDRLGLLFALGLAEERGGRVAITPGRGRLFARLTGMLRALFGLPR
jgi:hypothetical protein